MNLTDRFWRFHEEYSFKAVDAFLYFYLLKIYRNSKFKERFTHSNKMILAQLNITKPMFERSRKKLKSVGLIDYVSVPGSQQITWIMKIQKKPSIYEV
ncbi:hypothetical protein BDD43_3511 [Mucilaginibacter gracilis]|uniref:Uncharacterized protein n=1 Tax=Mucilaginibacter gracilis TaxID=423350 RepID=A0A495J2U7_9SPHI|nr:hypothetical protein [Mucilaginibacter gracilis]RKR83306.1 hypothetical protein BDD43_3511 [Mucilaginibacter gracilis]